MKKILIAATLILVSAGAFAQKVGVLNGPSGIPCAWLMENSSDTAKIEFEKFASAQVELPKLLKGEIDIGFLPPNAAAKVFNSGNKKIKALGIAGNGNLFLLTKNPDFKSLSDLKGCTVQCAGQGATPEYLFKFLLERCGAGEVELDFSVPNPEIAAALISGKAEYILVPEPFASVAQSKDQSVRRISLQEIYTEVTGQKSYPMTLLVANADYAETHRKEIDAFTKQLKKAGEWTIKNPDEAGKLVEKHGLGLKAPVAKMAIPNAAYVWIPSGKAQKQVESLLNIFLVSAPQSIGGKLPEKDFYY